MLTLRPRPEPLPAPPEVLSGASAVALEWPRLRAVLAALAATDLGRERLLALEPCADAAELGVRRAWFEEIGRLLAADGAVVDAIGAEIGTLLPRLLTDQPPVGGPEVVELGALLRTSRAAVGRIAAAAEPCPELGALAAPLTDPSPWIRRIEATLDRRGVVRDDASPLLVALRRRIQQSRQQLYDELGGLRERFREHLSEETIPLRGGRLVLVLSAGARGRVPGLLHGRSGTGRSFYFEPLEVVEANNTLQQSIEEDQAERERLLAELVAELREGVTELRAHAAFVALLDAVQALHRFATLAEARLPEVAVDGHLVLVAARHPLLDPKLAALRESALGTAGHRGAIVPLDVELGGTRRALVVTGPNAGGKTVALKTVGLLALAAQAGVPIPVGAGSRLPICPRLVAAVGDEQDLMADRSTFSGRLLRLGEIWEARAPGSLLLVDELGSGTDPEEGAALAIALLEGILEAGALAIVTSHLTRLAAVALDTPGAGCAAMEFSPATGRPTFRLLPGPPGGSEAIALARRLGLAPAWIDRAEAWLTPEHRSLQRLLGEVEAARHELLTARSDAEAERRRTAEARERLESERAATSAAREALAVRLKSELEAFRRETLVRLSKEVDTVRGEVATGKRRGVAEAAVGRLFAAAPQLDDEIRPRPSAGPLAVGAAVRHRTLGWNGRLDRLDGDRAEVIVRGKRLRCSVQELIGEGAASPVARPRAATPSASDVAEVDVRAEINLIGERVEPALEALDAFLDRAVRAGLPSVRVVHGHGTGRLRQAIREHLRRHPLAGDARPGEANEGGNGATVITLRD